MAIIQEALRSAFYAGKSMAKGLEALPSSTFDLQFDVPVVGIDEVGYGPWAGPVVTAALMTLSPQVGEDLKGQVKDSKKLSKRQREKAFEALTHHPHIRYAVGMATVEEIDQLNIREATCLAMHRALSHVHFAKASTILVDGTLPLRGLHAPVVTIIKGDQQSFSIAAASIIAKVTRDRLMEELGKIFPPYGWAQNVGYGTKAHQLALTTHGVTPHHRRSYAPIAKLLASQ